MSLPGGDLGDEGPDARALGLSELQEPDAHADAGLDVVDLGRGRKARLGRAQHEEDRDEVALGKRRPGDVDEHAPKADVRRLAPCSDSRALADDFMEQADPGRAALLEVQVVATSRFGFRIPEVHVRVTKSQRC